MGVAPSVSPDLQFSIDSVTNVLRPDEGRPSSDEDAEEKEEEDDDEEEDEEDEDEDEDEDDEDDEDDEEEDTDSAAASRASPSRLMVRRMEETLPRRISAMASLRAP